MKLNPDFVLRQVADTWVVLALAKASVDFNGIMSLNESGAMLWKLLEQGKEKNDLVDALLSEYCVSREQAAEDVDEFIHKLSEVGCLA